MNSNVQLKEEKNFFKNFTSCILALNYQRILRQLKLWWSADSCTVKVKDGQKKEIQLVVI